MAQPGRKSKKDLGRRAVSAAAQVSVQDCLQLAQLRSEKCELSEAEKVFRLALKQAKASGDLSGMIEALSGLLRVSSEAMDGAGLKKWENELDRLMASHPRQTPAMAWYCKGVVERHHGNSRQAQRHLHRFIRAVRRNPRHVSSNKALSAEEAFVKGWVAIANNALQSGHSKRAQLICEILLDRYQSRAYRGLNGLMYIILGKVAQKRKNYELAMRWYNESYASFLAEHNWYYHLYVLLAYAKVHRAQRRYAEAYWNLELVDKAASGPEFGLLKWEVQSERSQLQQDAIDLLIDGRKGIIKTREAGEVDLRKQYVLLHILEALYGAHSRDGDDLERGLSKAEIIERVWKERYRPEAHDNKLYYNINRLRKLIEPDLRKPQYLLNWKEGYRLAPGLRIQFVGNSAGLQAKDKKMMAGGAEE